MKMERTFGRVALINPNNAGNYVQGMFNREHLGLGYLAAELKGQGYEFEIIDSRIEGDNSETAAEKILRCGAGIVGFSIIAKSAADWCEKTSCLVKEERPDTHIVIGNYFPSLQPERALVSMPSVDTVVAREGDIAFPNLVGRLSSGNDWQTVNGIAFRTSKGIWINPPEKLVQDLDTLPFPIHTAHRYGVGEFAIEGARGCYRRCAFCSVAVFFDPEDSCERWRARSPQSIAAEIQENLIRFPQIRRYRFVDPDFVGAAGSRHIERLRGIAREFRGIKGDFEFIIDTRTRVVNRVFRELWHELRDAGLGEVFLGIETTDPEIKRMMGKDSSFEDDLRAVETLEKLGIRVRYGFMMITPWSDGVSIQTNARGLHHLGFPRLDKYFQEMYVVPGTRAVELTRNITDIWFDNSGRGEYYAYGLPSPIDQLRRMGRVLVDNNLVFMSQHQSLHERIRRCFEDDVDAGAIRFRDELNELSFDFFNAIFDQARRLEPDASDEIVVRVVNEMVAVFQPRLDVLEKKFASRNEE